MAGGVTVRPALEDDLAAVAAIYDHYVLTSVATFEVDPVPLREWSARFNAVASSGWPFLVAVDGADESGSDVVGYAYATQWKERTAYQFTVEDSVYVAPSSSGRGVGRALLSALLAGVQAAGGRQVVATISDTGAPGSVALHRSLGFVDVGRLRAVGFKHGGWVDVILMQRSLERVADSAQASS
jgi:phosphinothricin acetyltransferase